jgi:hypothetical protein
MEDKWSSPSLRNSLHDELSVPAPDLLEVVMQFALTFRLKHGAFSIHSFLISALAVNVRSYMKK